MSIRLAARLARREMRGGLKGFRVFLACLALGVAAIAAVGSVRESIQTGLDREGATLLGGDAEIQLTYRYAHAEERAWMDRIAGEVSETVAFRSMLVAGQGPDATRALTEVKAVDNVYPLLGEVELDPPIELDDALAPANGLPGLVAERLLVDRMGLAVGDLVHLGETEFELTAVLVRAPDTGGGFALAPYTIVRHDALDASGLLKPGTLFETAYRMTLPPGASMDALRVQAGEVIANGGGRWRDRRNGAPGAARFVDRLAEFLILVGLAGLAVGGVGISAAVRAYVDEKVPVIATLKSLGAEGLTIFQTYLLQIAALAGLGIVMGLVIGALLPLAAAPLIAQFLPIRPDPSLHPVPLAQAAVYGVLTASVFALWPLARTERIRAAALFRDAALGLHGLPRRPFVVVSAALLVLLVAVAVLFSGEARLTLWSAGGLLAAYLALILTGFALRFVARRLARNRTLRRMTTLGHALGSVGGPGSEAATVIVSLGLGLSVLAAIGQIDSNLRAAVTEDLPDVAPSFFFVDIQSDQMEGFRERLESDPQVSKLETAPMLRGIITRINGRPAREVAGPHWVLSGDRGITYSDAPPDGAEITEGTWWPADYTGEPQISFSAEEGAEMGLKLGDRLTVNILGREISGIVTSFRNVDFSNAGMGFVLSMNPAAISGAPHSNIATVYAEQEAEAAILRDLATRYPNITAIGVRDTIERFAGVMRAIASAITYGALASLVTGGIVLIGAAAAGERARSYEAAILKTLGAARATVLLNFALRSAIMGLAAGLVAITTGAAAGWGVMTYVMESPFQFDAGSAVLIIGAGLVLTLVTGAIFSMRSLAARPARVLRARE